MIAERIPFEEAIHEPLLLKRTWVSLSGPQQVMLKALYGLSLDTEEERYHWSVLQGGAKFDDLGFPVTPVNEISYTPTEFNSAWAILGRRSGKTDKFLSFVLAYETSMGGHMRYVAKRQKCRSFIVAQKLPLAQAILDEFVMGIFDESPILKNEVEKANADGILLKNGHVLAPSPPTRRSFRGFAVPIVACDEVGFWYSEEEAANPDYEVIRAVEYAQIQFPDHKLLGASTPWSKEGILWAAHNAGTNGNKLPSDDEDKARFHQTVVFHAPTPALENPILDRRWFSKTQLKDPDAYIREVRAQFVDAVSGMFPDTLLNDAMRSGPHWREALPRPGHPEDMKPFYVAALDPAFRKDKFAFCIGHYEPDRGFVQDWVQSWKPEKNISLNPAVILDEIAKKIKEYHVVNVFSDQYQLEALKELALDRGFVIQGQDFTANSKAKIYGSFQTLLRTDRVRLLNNKEQRQELLGIEKHVGSGGNVRIGARVGNHDDLATVVVLCANKVIGLVPVVPKNSSSYVQELNTHDKCMKQIIRKRRKRQGRR